MSEKFPGHGIVGPMGGPGPAAPDQISGQNIPQKIRGQKIPPKIRFYLHREFRAAGIRFYLHKEFARGRYSMLSTQTYMLKNFPAARA